MTIKLALVIFLGGGTGACLRYTLSTWVQQMFPGKFPLGILTVNLLGSLLFGILAVFLQKTDPVYRALLLTGFLGALTTFSTFSYDNFLLFKNGQTAMAWLNILFSNSLCLGAAWGGSLISQKWIST